ncbi:toprim domain-containing protein [Micromonospora sp. NPDC049662]|uniref:toprim domain-containing protein n=1 Tax=Micromonospora sp. NPDC049662 TaxID=3155397 RepID=UPI00341ACBFF
MSGRDDPDPRRLIAAHELANEFYRSHLTDEPRALAYLRSRGIVAATAQDKPWTIGYAPRGWVVLREHLRAAGFSDAELLAAGLVTTARNGNLIDVFRDRVMFPIRDGDGQVVAFTGRDLSGRPGTPKYRNTTSTAIYSKKSVLYGLAEQLRDGGVQPDLVMIVEGPADVVAVAGLRHSLPDHNHPYVAVAPCGTALTAEQVALLADAVPSGTPIAAAFDADAAGQGAIDKSYQLLRGWSGPVEAMSLPAGSDPASLIADGPVAAAAALALARMPLVDLVAEHRMTPHLNRLQERLDELARFGRDPSSESFQIRLDALHAVAPLLAEVGDRDAEAAARLTHQVTLRLDLNPLTVFEAIYPPADDELVDLIGDPEQEPTLDPAALESAAGPAEAGPATPMSGAGFPDPQVVGHQYARTSPTGAAATWVQHDPSTGHTAWVIAEGAGDTAADRDAAALAGEIAGRVAVLVGAQRAVEIARTAVNAHFAALGPAQQGNASIVVLTSFDGNRPVAGRERFTVAWAGDARAYAMTPRWIGPLTIDHTLRGQAGPGAPPRAGDGALTASVRGGAIGVNRIDVPVTRIVLSGRSLSAATPAQLREALERHQPAAGAAALGRLGGPSAVALVVRPRPDRVRDTMTAARLARQDQGPTTAPGPGKAQSRERARRVALPAAPAARRAS